MAKTIKVKTFSVSTPEDLSALEEFLSAVKNIESMVHVLSGKVMIVYEEG